MPNFAIYVANSMACFFSKEEAGTSTTVAYRPFTALTYYILWLSATYSTKYAALIHYATVVLGPVSP